MSGADERVLANQARPERQMIKVLRIRSNAAQRLWSRRRVASPGSRVGCPINAEFWRGSGTTPRVWRVKKECHRFFIACAKQNIRIVVLTDILSLS